MIIYFALMVDQLITRPANLREAWQIGDAIGWVLPAARRMGWDEWREFKRHAN